MLGVCECHNDIIYSKQLHSGFLLRILNCEDHATTLSSISVVMTVR
jgi:hypothetical protein